MPHKLGIGVLGYLLVDIGVETALGALCRQVLLRLASSALENLSAKWTSCSLNSSTPEFMFEFTSPRKLGSVNLNMNSGVLEAESVKLSPFSGELHLVLYFSALSSIISRSKMGPNDFQVGQKMIRDRSFEQNSDYFSSVFEIGRRHKLLNPECMR